MWSATVCAYNMRNRNNAFISLPYSSSKVPLTEEELEQPQYADKIGHIAINSNYTMLFFIMLIEWYNPKHDNQ